MTKPVMIEGIYLGEEIAEVAKSNPGYLYFLIDKKSSGGNKQNLYEHAKERFKNEEKFCINVMHGREMEGGILGNKNVKYYYAVENNYNMDDKFKSASFYDIAIHELKKGKQKMPLGKYKGKRIKDIRDKGYLRWLYPKLDEGWLKLVLYYQRVLVVD